MNNLLKTFDAKFNDLHNHSFRLIEKTPTEKLFWKPIDLYAVFSFGEYILRSAGLVEQTFGGIMTRLWDDPFEWTLPEELSTNKKILDYLNEVEKTRKAGFAFFNSDEDLQKEIPTLNEMNTIFKLLLDTLTRAENLQGRAEVILLLINNDNGFGKSA